MTNINPMFPASLPDGPDSRSVIKQIGVRGLPAEIFDLLRPFENAYGEAPATLCRQTNV